MIVALNGLIDSVLVASVVAYRTEKRLLGAKGEPLLNKIAATVRGTVMADVPTKKDISSLEFNIHNELEDFKSSMPAAPDLAGLQAQVQSISDHVDLIDNGLGQRLENLEAAIPKKVTEAILAAKGREAKAIYAEMGATEEEMEKLVASGTSLETKVVEKIMGLGYSDEEAKKHPWAAGLLEIGKAAMMERMNLGQGLGAAARGLVGGTYGRRMLPGETASSSNWYGR